VKTTVNLVAAIALTGVVTGFAINAFCAASQSKSPDGHRGRQAATHASGKNASNTSLWSADPEHGWVRADDRRKRQEQTRPSNGGKAKIKKAK
jgi:hypothetical protein